MVDTRPLDKDGGNQVSQIKGRMLDIEREKRGEKDGGEEEEEAGSGGEKEEKDSGGSTGGEEEGDWVEGWNAEKVPRGTRRRKPLGITRVRKSTPY